MKTKKDFERDARWSDSVFMYEHKFTEDFDKLMIMVYDMRRKLEDEDDPLEGLNADRQLTCLKYIEEAYERCMNTTMLDI
jgi:hypothetical protein